MALNKVFIGGCPMDLIYKTKSFVLDKGSLGQTPMTRGLHTWHMHE